MENKLLSLEDRISSLENQMKSMQQNEGSFHKEDQVILIVFSQELDKVLPALIIASSAAALGMKVKLFFTFWGINAIKKKRILSKKKITEKMMALMAPKSLNKLPISNLNMLGIGPPFMKYMMKEHNIASQNDLINACREEGVEFCACEMTMSMMGITRDELIENIKFCGVTSIISEAAKSSFTLFI